MKKLLIFCGFILSCGYVSAQNYGATYTPISRPTNSNYSQSTTNYYIENQESETEWEEHEITGIYTQAQSLEDIKRSDCIKINDDYYIPARVKNGTYDIEIIYDCHMHSISAHYISVHQKFINKQQPC